jgi:HEAT repeat protein
LVEGALTGDAEARDEAAGALSRVVKALADEPIEESLQLLRFHLPDLVAGLVNPDPFLQGQLISITRRIRPDPPTVDRLLGLLSETPPADRVLVVVALGLCEDGAWTERVERALVDQLPHAHCRDAAAEALYAAAWQDRVALQETLHALASIAIRGAGFACDHAALALGLLLAGDQGTLAARLLEDVLASGPESVRVKVAEVLGWRMSERGRALLDRCLADPSPRVRAAAEASLARRR